MFTPSATSGTGRIGARLALASCFALAGLCIPTTQALASSTTEVPTAASTYTAASAAASTVEAVGSTVATVKANVTNGCEGQAFSQPFEAFGDSSLYTLVGGSEFNSPEEGWELGGGARIVPGIRPNVSFGGVLYLPRGGEAVSPPVCVTLQYPTARLWLRRAEGSGSIEADVAYTKSKTTAVIEEVAKLKTGSGWWSPSETFEVRPQLGGEVEGPRPVRFVFIGKGERESAFQLFGLYVDPRLV